MSLSTTDLIRIKQLFDSRFDRIETRFDRLETTLRLHTELLAELAARLAVSQQTSQPGKNLTDGLPNS